MILLDTNILIYLANGTLPESSITGHTIGYASITKIETMGYSQIRANELLLFQELFKEFYSCELTSTVVNRAIQLRQAKKMSLGDSIVAATALEYKCELWTANYRDFKHIDELRIHNPLQSL